jgi:hypothetical protein
MCRLRAEQGLNAPCKGEGFWGSDVPAIERSWVGERRTASMKSGWVGCPRGRDCGAGNICVNTARCVLRYCGTWSGRLKTSGRANTGGVLWWSTREWQW